MLVTVTHDVNLLGLPRGRRFEMNIPTNLSDKAKRQLKYSNYPKYFAKVSSTTKKITVTPGKTVISAPGATLRKRLTEQEA
jgi:hypothetical protein